ncbi:uncharacterized protein N7496_009872 [Penicillium cataractarum]|uniref:BZIP domain-containing protein n=1 Tax=Penicillium cataractarum TaxID=2100454 RepID=A0A9W9RSE3_9EURO|nr:uncharacterized protein N7496_009872 [Penicillium cataractarum]KAJ5364159.1 hypothetical protein N7496_009872 [Penicillium cataractarum]
MDAENSQKNIERLARVRENQRKSRARKQEYVRELEQRLATFKNEAQQKDIQHRLASQKLEAENRHLRTLLGSLGISAELVQQYLQIADQGTAVNRKVAIPAMQRPVEMPVLSPSSSSETNPRSSSARASASSACSMATDGSTPRETGGTPTSYTQIASAPNACAPIAPAPSACAPTACAPTACAPSSCGPTGCTPVKVEPKEPQLLQQPLQEPSQQSSQQSSQQALQQPPQQPSIQPKLANPSLCDCSPGDAMAECDDDLLNTTLCSMAEELINQYNINGIDIEEIRKRLWAGFKAGARGDGCRVENQVLFQVLDEISNGM